MATGELRVELVLTGAYAGKTIKINNLDFHQGSCFVQGNPQNVQYALAYYASYGAYLRGSEDYQRAVERDGKYNPKETSQPGNPETLSGEVQSSGSGIKASESVGRDGTSLPATGSEGLGSDRDGLRYAGISNGTQAPSDSAAQFTDEVSKRLAVAVKKLDPDDDNHWTDAGLPKISAIVEAFGGEGVTRQDVNNAIDWNRDKAREALVQDL